METFDFENKCFICKVSDKLGDKKQDTVNVRSGLQTLRTASEARSDGFFALLNEKESVTVHIKCRSTYIHRKYIQSSVNKKAIDSAAVLCYSPQKKKLRKCSDDSDFNWKSLCFIC